ncbi:hypothetical protein GHK92_03870 [Nocardioides sp. dk4132]|uniref:hypothetical protein n=1 Tax=unclassified Nocardioides TaxID=2615069 RepID=UPI001295357C|nr:MULTISPECIES: hypothetical protein [unclassified Nocardioides]MQW74999.1 hypothetical protein [Nocardioides sp. dk4132]QGA07823.1 hypothetical protein GFH29_10740 [Nocardioides sp. dk884]
MAAHEDPPPLEQPVERPVLSPPARWLVRLLTVLGVLCLFVGVLAGVVNREVVDGGAFAEHADAVRADPAVARHLGVALTDQVLEVEPELGALRPLVESTASALIASDALGPVVRSVLEPLHGALVSTDQDQVVLRIADVAAVLVTALREVAPDAGAKIPDDLEVTLSAFGGQELTAELIETAQAISLLSWLLPLLGVLLLAGAGLVRRRTWDTALRTVGEGALVVVALLVVGNVVTGAVLGAQLDDDLSGALVLAIWDELDDALWRTTAVVGAVALLTVLVSTPEARQSPAALAARGRELALGTGTPRATAVRGAALVLLGVLLVARPLQMLAAVLAALGVALTLFGLLELARSLITYVDRVSARPGRAHGPVLRALAGGLAALLIAGTLVLGGWPAGTTYPAASAPEPGCNGYVELCDRRYDEIAQVATHNSMSAVDESGWFLGEQPTGVMGQLEDGVRVFLIDSWYGQPTDREGVTATAEDGRDQALAEARELYGEAVVESALRVRSALSLEPTGEPEPYLCHALCELGSTPWTPLMTEVEAWLEANPREVVTFFIQDEVSPEDTAKVFDDAGLLPYVHTPVPGEPWPTLAEMGESGHRVVVLHENVGGGEEYPWIIDATIWSQDTPYSFERPSDFSCELFRGRATAPLFLVNHWLSGFATKVASARRVNSEEAVLSRLEQCWRERGQIPNFVAIDHYDVGDAQGAVDQINGVG